MCLILFYNTFFGAAPDISDLSVAHQQLFTCDHRRFDEANAVVFFLPSLPPISSLRKPAGHVWVLWSTESAVNYPAMADPSFLKHFDLVMTYERNADVWFPYLPKRRTWDEALKSPLPVKTERTPAVMFQSSIFNRSGRIGYVAELMKHMNVDSFGKILRTRTLSSDDRGVATKLETIGRYKFCIAMENSICEDYVTEKFFEPLMAGTVPVYLGAENIDVFAPGEDCYINVRHFSGPRDLADYLMHLDADDAAYGRFFEWRKRPLRKSFERDFERCGTPFANLLKAVEAHLQNNVTARNDLAEMSFDPAASNPADPGRHSVARFIYPQMVPSAEASRGRLRAVLRPLSLLFAFAMRAARLRVSRRRSAQGRPQG